MYNQKPRKIGERGDLKEGEKVDFNDFPILMKFHKKESIDVLIRALRQARKDME